MAWGREERRVRLRGWRLHRFAMFLCFPMARDCKAFWSHDKPERELAPKIHFTRSHRVSARPCDDTLAPPGKSYPYALGPTLSACNVSGAEALVTQLTCGSSRGYGRQRACHIAAPNRFRSDGGCRRYSSWRGWSRSTRLPTAVYVSHLDVPSSAVHQRPISLRCRT